MSEKRILKGHRLRQDWGPDSLLDDTREAEAAVADVIAAARKDHGPSSINFNKLCPLCAALARLDALAEPEDDKEERARRAGVAHIPRGSRP